MPSEKCPSQRISQWSGAIRLLLPFRCKEKKVHHALLPCTVWSNPTIQPIKPRHRLRFLALDSLDRLLSEPIQEAFHFGQSGLDTALQGTVNTSQGFRSPFRFISQGLAP